MKKILLGIASVTLLFSCSLKEENERMKVEIEQLKSELGISQLMAQTLEEIGGLLDSIDKHRQVLRLDMEMGTTYADYTNRMSELNDYVSQTERRISELEDQLQQGSEDNSALSVSLKRLKKELTEKSQEIARLNEQVEKYRQENQTLLTTVGLQDAEIQDKAAEIEIKRQELEFLENRIQEVLTKSKMDEADAYFARAEAVEEAARRTKLAPRKKKETLKEALELYKKAASMGREDATAKITELEKKI
ncbi:MAG: hypothetical protein O6848_05920 [Bacteroidetes bacterium]|nr:hypothetical protein [Bacteroidota bacterium]